MNGAQLIRSVGLIADGPVVWGRPVTSRKPGVYVVELPAPQPRTPLDHAALRGWIERVPTLQVDGARPTPHELAARLNEFWLPAETVMYVGRSNTSLGGRVAALYQTPLGDPRPFAGGHWVKTLNNLSQLRIWWAATDSPEEYEDALLSAFADSVPEEARTQLRDATVVLPFANLATATGQRKPHGISGSLLPVPEQAPAPSPAAKTGSKTTAGRSTSQRTTTPRKTPATPRASTRAAASRPAREPTLLSRDRIDAMREELRDLQELKRPEIVARIKAARELGDLRENADYQEARREQSFLEGRIQSIENILRNAVELQDEPEEFKGQVRIGSTVMLESSGETLTYRVVAPTEASPAEGRVSYMSPIGQALMGARAGDEVKVRAPAGEIGYRVREVS